MLDEYLAGHQSREGPVSEPMTRRWWPLVAETRSRGMEVVICALTIIEAVHARTNRTRLSRPLFGLRVIPVGDGEAKTASAVLTGAGLQGPGYAIDAAVIEAALRQQGPMVMLTSGIDDMTRPCADRVRPIAV